MKFKTLITPEGKYMSIKWNGCEKKYFLLEVCVPELYPNDFDFNETKIDFKPTTVELNLK